MRICFVTFGNYDQHATLKRATGLAQPLQRLGHEVFILLENAPANIAKASLECPTADIYWHTREPSCFAEQRQKQSIVDYLAPDVTWICGLGPRNWIRKTSRRSFLIADHSELYSVVEKKLIRRWSYKLIERLSCIAVDAHICASHSLYCLYSQWLLFRPQAKPPLYLPYAANPRPQAPPTAQHATSPNKKIMYAGSLWKEYGIWEMLKSIRYLRSYREDFTALIVGKGPELEPARHWVQEHSAGHYISLPGYIEEHEFQMELSTANVFLCPLEYTDQDRFRCPSKLFEYVQYTKPVVTRGVGEALQLFGRDYPYYYLHNTPESLSESLFKALKDCTSDAYALPAPEIHTWAERAKVFLKWYNRISPNRRHEAAAAR